jgi:hypothetical protein
MIRRLFSLVCVLSLALSLAFAVLWVRSLWTGDSVRWFGAAQNLDVYTGPHLVMVTFEDDVDMRLAGAGWMHLSYAIQKGRNGATWPWPRVRQLLAPLGFYVDHDRTPLSVVPGPVTRHEGGRAIYLVCVPYWLLVAGTGLPLPLLRVPGFVRSRRRSARGLCVGCGYDLRATPGRCPECGRESGGEMGGAGKAD